MQPSRHLLIAGTGRAGTSFLVRWLTALGLDTHIARHGEDQWDDTAQAGFETLPFGAPPGTLPYVLKSPWLAECIDALLAWPAFAIDAVVIPVRDLAEVAASRIAVERQAVQRQAPWIAEAGMGWSTWSGTKGGAIYSLHPLDQARVLAVGFHHLVQRLTAAEVPIVLLAYPRMATDAAYLFSRLRPHLPMGVSEQAARDAHATEADTTKLRVGGELAAAADPESLRVEAIALRRSLAESDAAARIVGAAHEQATAQVAALQAAQAETYRSAVAAHEAAALFQQEAARLQQALTAAEAALAQARRTAHPAPEPARTSLWQRLRKK